MFKNVRIIFAFIALMLFPVVVSASGSVTVSSSNLNIALGNAATFSITANNAAGRIDISSSNSTVASVSTSSVFLDKETTKITVRAGAVGSAQITVRLTDVSTYDSEVLTGKTYTINVNVNNYSNNNALQSISVEGYELIQEDNNRYSLTVDNSVTSINILAVAADSKSTISGVGVHDINIGENDIEVVVTAESGANNVVHVIVTRKEGYFIADLSGLLENNVMEKPEIIIDADTEISSELIDLIKDASKTVVFNMFDENKNLLYSWTVDGKKVDSTDPFLSKVSYSSEYQEQIKKASNYADGMYIHFSHEGTLPKGTKVKLNVAEKFSNDSVVNLYYYNPETEKLELVKDKLQITDGYVEYEIEHCSDYFLTESEIGSSANGSINIFKYISIVEFAIILGIVLVYFLMTKNKKQGIINVE